MKHLKGDLEHGLIEEAVDLVKPTVLKIENSIPTTKDHYDQYAQILSLENNMYKRTILAAILIKAGANAKGVISAYRLLNPM